jgi:hypothetical protein
MGQHEKRDDDHPMTMEEAVSLIDSLKGTMGEAMEKGRSAVAENAERINSVIDTVSVRADGRTGGRYTDQITRAATTAKQGISTMAEDGEDSTAQPGARGR